MEANTYNRYIPLNVTGDLTDDNVLESLAQIGYQVSDETIYIAKCRLLNEAQYPVETGSKVREPKFEEIKSFLINANDESGLLLGSIKNTDKLFPQMSSNLKNLYHLYSDKYDKQIDVPFIFNLYEMVQYPHIGVFGGSGSGKSYGLRVMIEELMKKEIPTIIFDPHYEMEFDIDESNPSAGYNYSKHYKVFELGKDIGVDFRELNSGELKKLLSAKSGLTEAMKATVDLLWGQYDMGAPDINTFTLFINEVLEVLGSDTDYSIMAQNSSGEEKDRYIRLDGYHGRFAKRVNESTLRGINWRLDSLKRQGVFSKDSKELINTLKMGKTCVIQGNQSLLLVYGSYLINNIYNQRRNYIDKEAEYFPPFLIITDEAHNFAPKGEINAPTRSVIREIAQEGRKYGVFLVLATQRPTLLDETVTAQLNSKFIFRTVRGTDIQTIREETDISAEEAKRLPYLRTGDLFASIASMGRTIFSRIRAAETLKPNVANPFYELKEKQSDDLNAFYRNIENYLPITEGDLPSVIKELERNGIRLSVSAITSKLDRLVHNNIIEVTDNFLGLKEYKKSE